MYSSVVSYIQLPHVPCEHLARPTLGSMLWGHEGGTCFSDNFPRATCPFFVKKISCRYQIVVPATFRKKFSSFEFICHEAVEKNDLNFQSHIFCTSLTASCAPVCPLSLRNASYACTRRGLSLHSPQLVLKFVLTSGFL